MIKGGYQIIDLENKYLTINVGMVYEGVYEQIENTTKPILISGLAIEDTAYSDLYSYPKVDGSDYVFIIDDNIKLRINDLNVVTAEEF